MKVNNSTRLSKHFTLGEMRFSRTAMIHGIENNPKSEHIDNLRRLCVSVLEPIREHFGVPFSPNSAYRSLELNRKIGSKDHSAHVDGRAADIEINGVDNRQLWQWCIDNLGRTFDQCILEKHTSGVASSGWVHLAIAPSDKEPRRMYMVLNERASEVGFVA